MSLLRMTLCALCVTAGIGGATARAADGGSDGAPTQCGGVSYVGCCDGTTLRYCLSGQLVGKQCPNACGWNVAFALYGCGSSAGADPSGVEPRACPAAPDAGAEAGPPDASPDAVSPDAVSPDAVSPDAGAGCGAVPYAGCCDGDTLRFCSGNAVLALVCAAGSCGWNATRGFYGCDTTGGTDPSATYARSCAQVVGDAGLPDAPVGRDGGADMPRDSASDAVADGASADADAGADFGGADDSAPGDADGPDGGRDALGLDALGFDGARRDSGTTGSDDGGCGCATSGAAATDGAATLCTLALLLWWDRRRRRS